jgi:hypothetical protein
MNRCIIVMAAVLTMANSGDARRKTDRSPFLAKLVECRALSDHSARLACYDVQVDALDAAERSKQIVVVDKAQVSEARRGLFGFTLPSLKIFGGDDDDQEARELESTVAAASQNGDGQWFLVLQDGARWRQIDNKYVAQPKKGQKISIRKSGIGTYFASIMGRNGFKVRREN